MEFTEATIAVGVQWQEMRQETVVAGARGRFMLGGQVCLCVLTGSRRMCSGIARVSIPLTSSLINLSPPRL